MNQRAGLEAGVVPLVVVIVIVFGASGFISIYYSWSQQPSTSQTPSSKASSVSVSNTYLTSCTITGVGGFEFRVVSDSTGTPVSGESIKAVDRLGCNGESQVVYLDEFSPPVYVTNFTESDGGWLVPDFPGQATPAGQLSFTITYQGGTYNFTAYIPPMGTNCVTLHVPSGNVTSTSVMNGSGSYCS